MRLDGPDRVLAHLLGEDPYQLRSQVDRPATREEVIPIEKAQSKVVSLAEWLALPPEKRRPY